MSRIDDSEGQKCPESMILRVQRGPNHGFGVKSSNPGCQINTGILWKVQFDRNRGHLKNDENRFKKPYELACPALRFPGFHLSGTPGGLLSGFREARESPERHFGTQNGESF